LLEKTVHSIGPKLREAREAQGIQLEEAANVTRIGKNYLIALEEEMFSRLPSPAYVKGFLRVYAGFLGLSGDEIVSLYEKSLPKPQTVQRNDEDGGDLPAKRKIPFSTPLFWSIPILLLIPVGVWLYSTLGNEKVVRRVVTGNNSVQKKAAPVFIPRSTVAHVKDNENFPSQNRANENIAPSTPLRSGIILKLKVNQDCWLSITIDDLTTQQYDLKAGDLIEWKGEKVFALDLGNAGGVEAELNGRSLPPFGGQGKSVHVVLKEGNV
jgi:cytoskeletal protein RodZ